MTEKRYSTYIIHQNSRTEASPSNGLVSYQDIQQNMQSAYFTAPAKWTQEIKNKLFCDYKENENTKSHIYKLKYGCSLNFHIVSPRLYLYVSVGISIQHSETKISLEKILIQYINW